MMSKQIKDFLKEWVFPPGFVHTIYRARKKRLLRVNRQELVILQRNLIFRNLCEQRRCFVIGNGPSINKQDLKLLACEITFTMNYFHNHPILENWQPTFYCAADPSGSYTPEQIKQMKPVSSKIHPQAYFFPLSIRPIIEEHKLFPREKTYYLKMIGGPLYDWPAEYGIDLTRCLPGARTTPHMALMLAIFMGCSSIYLIGCDYDYLSHKSVEHHFYPSSANEVGTTIDLSTRSYMNRIEGALLTFRCYEALGKIARHYGCEIFNATPDSFIDVFERRNYESLFQK